MRTRTSIVVAAAVAVVLVAAGVGVASWRGWFADPSVDDAPRVRMSPGTLTTVATGLRVPWDLAFLPPGTAPANAPDAVALVTERDTARILAVRPDGQTVEVARIAEARPRGEGGLMGVALSPDYATDRWVYVYYTAERDNRITRFKLGGSAQEEILTGIPKAGNHNGGRIAFGPDGMLYAGTGDAAEVARSQDLNNPGGKILRMTREGEPAPGNPFPGSLVYSYGHRNVQGLAWDATGQLFATEFGQNSYDELNRIEAGKNYGWPDVEGAGGGSEFVDPVATWATDDASPSGLAVRDGEAWLACLRGRKVYRIGTDGGDPRALLSDEYGRLRHVAAAPDGAMWVLTSNHDGRGRPDADDDRILRIEP